MCELNPVEAWFPRVFRLLFGALMCFVFVCVFCLAGRLPFACNRALPVSNPVLLPLGFAAVLLLSLLTLFLLRKTGGRSTRRIGLLSAALLPLQYYLVRSYYSISTWDSGAIRGIAYQVANGIGLSDQQLLYLQWYPGNRLLAALEVFLARVDVHLGLSGARDGYLLMIFLLCAICCVSAYLLYATVRELADARWGCAAYLLYFLLIWLNPWSSQPYSDALALLFPILTLYLFVRPKIKPVWKIVLIGLLAPLAYRVKPYAAIPVIAVGIVATIRTLGRWKRPECLLWLKKSVLLPGLIFLLSVSASSLLLAQVRVYEGFEANPDYAMFPTHFMMIGLNPKTQGVWEAGDVEMSQSLRDPAQRKAAEIAVIRDRLQTYGIRGCGKLLCEKTLTYYNDGTFAWGCEGGFFATLPDAPNITAAPFLRSVYLCSGENYGKLALAEQALWLSVLVLSFLSLFGARRDRRQEFQGAYAVIILSAMGYAALAMLLEVRARHLYSLAPFYIILATLGIRTVFDFLKGAARRQGQTPPAPAADCPREAEGE